MENDNLDILIAEALRKQIDPQLPTAEFYGHIAARGLRERRWRRVRTVSVAASVALLAAGGASLLFFRGTSDGAESSADVWTGPYVASVAAVDDRLRSFDEVQMRLRDDISNQFPYVYDSTEK